MSIHSLNVSLPRLPASHKRCKVAWFGDAGGSETIETIPNIILQASRIDLLFALLLHA